MDIKKIVNELIVSRYITKGMKTIIKLGGEGIRYTTISDGEIIWYELSVDIIDYVDRNVYRKTHNIYNLPYGNEPSVGISARNAVDMYQEYLIDSVVEYVDSNNKKIEWQENVSDSFGAR